MSNVFSEPTCCFCGRVLKGNTQCLEAQRPEDCAPTEPIADVQKAARERWPRIYEHLTEEGLKTVQQLTVADAVGFAEHQVRASLGVVREEMDAACTDEGWWYLDVIDRYLSPEEP